MINAQRFGPKRRASFTTNAARQQHHLRYHCRQIMRQPSALRARARRFSLTLQALAKAFEFLGNPSTFFLVAFCHFQVAPSLGIVLQSL